MTITKLRVNLAYLRTLILLHCKIIDELKKLEREYLAELSQAQGAANSPGAVSEAMARVGEAAWQWDGRCRN